MILGSNVDDFMLEREILKMILKRLYFIFNILIISV